MPIGLDIDHLRVVALRVADDGTVDARASIDVGKDVARAARTALGKVRKTAGAAGGDAVGVASIAPDGKETAAAVTALQQDGVPVDSNAISTGAAAALAEAWIGAVKGARDVVYFSVSDRTMAGILRAGAPFGGARGRAASVAWLALNPIEREDYRKIGCLEAEVAAQGIVRRFIWRVKAGDTSRVQHEVGDLSAVTVDHVLNAARDGDGVSVSVVRDTAKYIGMAAANVVAILDPEALVLGGFMSADRNPLFDLVRTEIGRRLPRPMMDALTIVRAALGDDAAAVGAARFTSARR